MDSLTKQAKSVALSSVLQRLDDKLHDNPLKPVIVQIATDKSPDPVIKPDLEDGQKRWLIVGICLHSIISPALRLYIPNTVKPIYTRMVQKHRIHTQSFKNYMKRYKPTNKELNYESINNNGAVPRIKGKPDVAKYDYAVKSDVEFSKLFFPTSMAHYSGFDSSCDSSALLGIIINIDFPANVQSVAEKVRHEIRNPWAHCNFQEWDLIKYQNSFQIMFQLVKNLQLQTAEETTVIGELTQWQTNGIQLLQGTTIGLELLQQLKRETRTLGKYLLEVVVHTDECITESHKAILKIEEALNTTQNIVHELKTDSSKLNVGMDSLSAEVIDLKVSHTQLRALCEASNKEISNLQAKTNTLENKNEVDLQSINKMKSEMASIRSDLTETSNSITKSKVEIIYNRNDIKDIKMVMEKNKSQIQETKSRCMRNESEVIKTKIQVRKNSEDIAKLSQQVSRSRVLQNSYFFLPDRVSSFVAREEEIEQLLTEFSRTKNHQHTLIICGLGGIGKTTLSVEFAWRYQTWYPAGIFWMSAETNDALEDSIQRLAIHIDKMGRDNKETLHKVLNWLSLLQDQWLLIIDNVDVYELFGAMKELVHGSWKRFSKGHVIITSRREVSEAESEFHVNACDCITLDVLSMSESRDFMIRRSGATDDNSLDTLVGELGGLPLALEQASAHIKTLKCTYKDYLEKFQRKRLKFMQKSKSLMVVSDERRTVLTTWHLNFDLISKQSKDEGLGTAALTAMKVSAYLYADEIPLCVLNVGSPNVCDEDILDCLHEAVGANMISAILSRFSLFRETGRMTLSVHRLVQEVVREDLTDTNEQKLILECAVRMVNKALESTHSPLDALKERRIGRNSLQLWSKLCLHANTVRKHLLDFARKHTIYKVICVNPETTRLLQASAIYHSFNQRQDEALACQEQMLSILPALDISESALRDFTSIKIPLLNSDRLVIQENLIPNAVSQQESSAAVLLDPEILRIEGNKAFHLQKYHAAIQYYSEAVRASGQVDLRVLSKRSRAYLNVCDFENALVDAEKSIALYQDNKSAELMQINISKAYMCKAYAIANLIRLGQLPKSYEFVGLASAAVAGHLNNQCLFEYRMKIEYPIVICSIIENEKNFAEQITSLHKKTHPSFLLRKGRFELPLPVRTETMSSMQIIGIEDSAEVFNSSCILFKRSKRSSLKLGSEPEFNIHFENVSFPTTSGAVCIDENVNATFYRCKFYNGRKACEEFPTCKGDAGCRNTNPILCRERYKLHEDGDERIVSGVRGDPGLLQIGSGRVVVDNCILDRCGGVGICSNGEGATLVIKNSDIRNMREIGVEVEYGATFDIDQCTIMDNQFHGVSIGPRAVGKVQNCIIRGNFEEGIYCGIVNSVLKEMSLKVNLNLKGGTVCIIKGNSVSQNGKSGIWFSYGSYEVSGNRIFENWLWGMMVRDRSTASIFNNDVFENKCGGIRIGTNYSATVVFDGNTIRDHTGPAIHIVGSTIPLHEPMQREYMEKEEGLVEGEIDWYSIAPFITSRNVCLNNDKNQLHPTVLFNPVQTCCYCHNSFNDLKTCGKCKKATYCSKDCQMSHWKRHKNICTSLYSSYTIEIAMSETISLSKYSCSKEQAEHPIPTYTTTVPLPDLGKGTPPDRHSSQKFMVKVQSGQEYTSYNPTKYLRVYDQTQTIFFEVRNPKLYHLVCECGVLAGSKLTTKKIYCWAYFKDNGACLCIPTDNLPPFQNRW